jgi:hypothetical protein
MSVASNFSIKPTKAKPGESAAVQSMMRAREAPLKFGFHWTRMVASLMNKSKFETAMLVQKEALRVQNANTMSWVRRDHGSHGISAAFT